MAQTDIANILIATDFSKEADVAFGQAVAVAARTGAELTVLWAEPSSIGAPSGAAVYASAVAEVEDLIAGLHTERATALDALIDRAAQAGVKATPRIIQGEPDETIVTCAGELDAELIVTGTRGTTGFKRFFLGSVAQNVLRKSTTNVLIARGEPDVAFARILVPCDFSPASEKALRLAIGLAPAGASITVFHSWQYPPGVYGVNSPDPKPGPLADLRDSIVNKVQRQGNALVEGLRGDDYTLTFVHDYGPPASIIHERLERETYDLIAMGTHGYRGFQRLILGSVAEATVRHAGCSVLVAHAGDVAFGA